MTLCIAYQFQFHCYPFDVKPYYTFPPQADSDIEIQVPDYLIQPILFKRKEKKQMLDTLLAMLMCAIFAYQLGLYHGAKWSTNNFKKSKKIS